MGTPRQPGFRSLARTGGAFAPDDAWRYADDGFDRRERGFEYGYFHTAGSATLTLPAGRYTVEVSHGPEYRVSTRAVQVRAHAATVSLALRRLDDLPARGWYSADLHVHTGHRLGGEEDESLGGGVFRRQKVALTGFRRPAKLPPRNGTGGRAVEGARLESV